MKRATIRRATSRAVRSLVAPLVAVALLATAPLLAQDPTGEESADEIAAAEEPAGDLKETITVTARKREENIQEVPVAVTVVTGEELVDSGAKDISDLQADVPNLSIYAGRSQSTTLTAFMRGIGQADPLWGVDPGVGLYLDDVYIARPQGALLDVFDVERIEVLRGPQGTLYGKNTIGGAIKYVSKPLRDERGGLISFTPGSFGNQDVKLSLGGALVPGKLRAKVAFASMQHDGYGENLLTGAETSNKDTTAYRAALDWIASDDVKVQFAYDYTEDDANPKGLTRLRANPICGLFLSPCPPEQELFDTRSGLAQRNGTTAEGYSMVVDWRINPEWRFKSITAHRESDSENDIDFDTTPLPIADVKAIYFDEQESQELQFIYDGGGELSGVFGFYYFDGTAGGTVQNNFLNLLFGVTDGVADTESIAVFGDGSYALDDRWTLNLGLRYTEEDKRGRVFIGGYTDATFSVLTTVTSDFDKSTSFSSLAPKIGVDYKFSDDVMGYLTVSRGFKSGGYNVRAQESILPRTAEPFDDEVLSVAEVGLKSVLQDGRLILNTAIFHGAYDDVQVSTFTSYDGDGDGVDDSFLGDFLNAGDATIQGVEVEFDWTAEQVSWFGISGNVSYLDATPDTFLDADGNGLVDTQVITNAPEVTGSLRFNFNFPAWGGLISASAGVAHRDDSVLTNEGQGVPPIVQDAFQLYDAWIGWLSGDGQWRVGVAGRNLGDEEYLTNGYNIPVLGILQGSYGNPRTVTATVEYRF